MNEHPRTTDIACPTAHTETITERYVVVESIDSEEDSESLRLACGMLPGDWGRWKGNERIVVNDTSADAATAWARETNRAYQVSVTRRYTPTSDT